MYGSTCMGTTKSLLKDVGLHSFKDMSREDLKYVVARNNQK